MVWDVSVKSWRWGLLGGHKCVIKLLRNSHGGTLCKIWALVLSGLSCTEVSREPDSQALYTSMERKFKTSA